MSKARPLSRRELAVGGDRRIAIADAAIRVLAVAGGRGLTHRAVDHELGLADGSTGNYFSTRASLLSGCARRLAELDLADIEAVSPGEKDRLSAQDAGALVAAFLLSRLEGDARLRQLARVELLLEATRAEPLEWLFAELRQHFIAVAEGTLRAASVADPAPAARALVATFDGILFDELLYARTAVDRAVLAEQFTSFVAAAAAGQRFSEVPAT